MVQPTRQTEKQESAKTLKAVSKYQKKTPEKKHKLCKDESSKNATTKTCVRATVGKPKPKLVMSLPSPPPDTDARRSATVQFNKSDMRNIVFDSDHSWGSFEENSNKQKCENHEGKSASKRFLEGALNGLNPSRMRIEEPSKNLYEVGEASAKYEDLSDIADESGNMLTPEMKLRYKIRMLEQQEKVLNSRLIGLKVAEYDRRNERRNGVVSSYERTIKTIADTSEIPSRRVDIATKMENECTENKEVRNAKISSQDLVERVLCKQKSLIESLIQEIFGLKVTPKEQVADSTTGNIDQENIKSRILSSVADVSSQTSYHEQQQPVISGRQIDQETNENVGTALPQKAEVRSVSTSYDLDTKISSVENKAVNTSRRHTRHKSTCTKLAKSNSLSDVESNGVSISANESSNFNHVNRMNFKDYLKTVQIIVNIHPNGKCSYSVKQNSTNQNFQSSVKQNWRAVFRNEDKLTESSYYSPPSVTKVHTTVDKSTTKVHLDKEPKNSQKLRFYIDKLLSMRRESIDKLDVSSCSTELSRSLDNIHEASEKIAPQYIDLIAESENLVAQYHREQSLHRSRSNSVPSKRSTPAGQGAQNVESPTLENIFDVSKKLLDLNLSMTEFEQKLKECCAVPTELCIQDQQVTSTPGFEVLETREKDRISKSKALSKDGSSPEHEKSERKSAQKSVSDQINDIISSGRLLTMQDLIQWGAISKPFNYALDKSDISEDIPATVASPKEPTDIKATEKQSPELDLRLNPLAYTAELEQLIKQLGFSWMTTTLQKTQQASALGSSSSGESGNSKNLKSGLSNKSISSKFKESNASIDQFTPVVNFFKNNEKYISPIDTA